MEREEEEYQYKYGWKCNFYITMFSTQVLAISTIDDFIICFTYELFHTSGRMQLIITTLHLHG